MKHFKLSIYELIALCIIAGSVAIRLILISQNWPWTDSDEGTMGLMALHIAYRGMHPFIFYGQNYMGALQAYLGAAMFHLSGPSLFSLRLGPILLFVFFLVSLYLLTSTLYSRGLALVIIALLSVGARYWLTYQLLAYGGYPETLLFGTLAFFIASWLAITSQPEVSSRYLKQRCAGYAAWGLVVGLGIWSDPLILPFVAMPGLLLLLFCWRDFQRVIPVLCILICFIIGIFPFVYYNLRALPPGQNSLSSILWVYSVRGTTQFNLLHQLTATVQISLPTITGNPFCPVNEEAVLRDPTTPPTLTCTIIHYTWSFGYLLLFVSAIVLAAWTVWQTWRRWREHKEEPVERQDLARHVACLFLLASAVLAIFLFLSSTATVDWPGTHARYMIGLLIAMPAVLWPLWRSASTITRQASGFVRARSIASALVIALIGVIYLIGTIMVFGELPTAQAYNQQDQALIARLESIGATHLYGNYWTCDKLIFLSRAKIICAVIHNDLGEGTNRYKPYFDLVKADPQSAYVLPESDYAVVVKHWVEQNPSKYRLLFFEGFYIVQPR